MLSNPNAPKRKDLGIASAVLVLSQIVSVYNSSHNLSAQIDELKTSIDNVQSNQELYFVKKEEMKKVSYKLDAMNEQLIQIQRELRFIKNFAINDSPIETCSYENIMDDVPVSGGKGI